MPSPFSNPTTTSLTIWMIGLSRGLLRRNNPRGLGSGNTAIKRALGLLRKLEVFEG
jgi:hypothetical protein